MRTALLFAGLAALAAALAPPLHHAAETSFAAHMAQHLLLMLVAAPLLLMGAPVARMLRALAPRPRRALSHVLGSRALSALTRPAVAWAAFVAVMCGSHVPALYDAALGSPLLHAAEHAAYLGAALLFWLPLVGAEPLPHRPGPLARLAMLLLAMPPMALLGVALSSADHAVYDNYALADQRAGGIVMWFGGTLLMAAAALVVAWTALVREERRERAREAYGG